MTVLRHNSQHNNCTFSTVLQSHQQWLAPNHLSLRLTIINVPMCLVPSSLLRPPNINYGKLTSLLSIIIASLLSFRTVKYNAAKETVGFKWRICQRIATVKQTTDLVVHRCNRNPQVRLWRPSWLYYNELASTPDVSVVSLPSSIQHDQ